MAPRRVVPSASPLLVVAVCMAVAALSLLLTHQPTYDPWAWLVWGREIAHGDLNTVAGPSWKPLPVLFTTPFSLFGDAAPALWVAVARTGLLLAFVGGYRLAASLAGPVAGVICVAGMALIDRFISLSARGNSEGLLAACALWAVDRHRAGHPRQALLLGFAGALIRPEVWPFLALYALWLLWRAAPGERLRAAAWMALGGVLVLAAWFVPEKLGSGSALRGASRAREIVEGSPATAARPFVAVFTNSAGAVTPILYVGAVAAVGFALLAWRRRRLREPDLVVLLLAASSSAYMVIVGVLAEIGFTGNARYVQLPACIVCVLGAVGLVQGAAALAARSRLAVAAVALAGLALCVPFAQSLAVQMRKVRNEAALYDQLPRALELAGPHLLSAQCRPVFTGPFETQLMLWHLDETGDAIGIHPTLPGTIIARREIAAGRDTRFPVRVVHGGWVVRSTCSG